MLTRILFCTDGHAKVLDFGLAKLESAGTSIGPALTATVTMDAILTSPGSTVGTVAYMSPEQARAEEVDGRTDVFSFGTVLYEMATGTRAFDGKTPALIFKALLDDTPPELGQLESQLSQGLAEIVGKALEKDRELRYQSAAELRSDLRRLKRQSESGMAASSGRRRATSAPTARRVKIASALLLSAVVLAAGIFHFVQKRPARSIAVLPFVDSSKDVSSEYISDGITEGVIDKLSEIPDLRIMSRNSVFRFKGKQTDAQAAGKDLNVQAVLTGRIARQADLR